MAVQKCIGGVGLYHYGIYSHGLYSYGLYSNGLIFMACMVVVCIFMAYVNSHRCIEVSLAGVCFLDRYEASAC